MRRAVSLLALLAALLLFAAPASAAPSAVGGSGTLSGSGTSYTLVVANTGSDPIKCMRYFAPAGTTIASASGNGAASFGNGFGAQGLSLAQGQSATFSFTTSQPLGSDLGQLHLSGDCVSDVNGSLALASTPPTAGPCKCITFYARILPSSIALTNPGERGGLHMEFDVTWFMNCSTGSGGCTGRFELLPPQPALKLGARLKPLSGRIDCTANCAATQTGTMHFTLIGGRALGNPARLGHSYALTVKRTCQGKTVAPQTFVLKFNKIGLVDKAKSRLK